MRTVGDAIAFLRESILADVAEGQLCSDGTLIEHMNAAQDEFFEETRLLRDSSSKLTRFSLMEGVSEYALDPCVLSVLSASLPGEGGALVRATHNSLDGYTPPVDVAQWLLAINYGTPQAGKPVAFSTDEGVDTTDSMALVVRVWPTPSAEYAGAEVQLRVARLPAAPMSLDDLDAPLVVPRQYHMALIHGAAYRIYLTQDADLGDTARAATQLAAYNAVVSRAKRGAEHKMHAPMSWGFGRSGFSHSR